MACIQIGFTRHQMCYISILPKLQYTGKAGDKNVYVWHSLGGWERGASEQMKRSGHLQWLEVNRSCLTPKIP